MGVPGTHHLEVHRILPVLGRLLFVIDTGYGSTLEFLPIPRIHPQE
jgi:hypothetical protein